MKKMSLFVLATTIIYFGCSKKNNQSSSIQNPKSKTLVAIAGHDTSICMPFGGTGYVFKGILDGRGSHDSLGNIISYAWLQLTGGNPPVVVGNQALTDVEVSNPGTNIFWLEIKDDKGQIAYDSVRINVVANFEYEYDGLSWDSAVGALTTISERFKPGLIESWPDFTQAIINQSSASIINYNGECNDISSWQIIPFVSYDSIQLTPASLFYTLIPGHGVLFPEI